MAVVYTVDGAELREASGESFSTIVHSGRLTVKQAGNGLSIDVDGNAVSWVASASSGPFKRVDARSFMMATTDIMSFYYITLPKGLPEATYDHLNDIFTAAKEGKPLPKAPAPAAAAAAAAAAPTPSAPPAPAAAGAAAAPAVGAEQQQQPAGKESNPLGDFMGAIARKAAHDTQMLGNMIAQKAQHDMNALQDKKPAPST